MPTFTQPRTAAIMPDFLHDEFEDDYNSFHQPGEDHSYSSSTEFENATKAVQVGVYRDPIAQKIIEHGPLDLSYLERYTNHNEDFTDPTSEKFKKWFKTNKQAPTIAMHFAACAVEAQADTREGVTNVASQFFDQFNRSGMGIIDNGVDRSGKKKPLLNSNEKWFSVRIGRMYNVWYRETFEADGADLFATRKIVPQWSRPCPCCQSRSNSFKEVEMSPLWLHCLALLQNG